MVFDDACGRKYLALLRQEGVQLRTLVVRQAGRVVFQHSARPFSPELPHPLYSVTKSFTSCAVGLLVEDGLIDIDRPWISWFPEYREFVVDERFLRASARNLLTMTLGQDGEPYLVGSDDWVRAVVGKDLAHEPGEAFFYNSLCSHLLALLVRRVSGRDESELLQERLFGPLGCGRWWWEKDSRGNSVGGFGLHLSTPDLARFGQCLLDGGVWEGQRVLPERWVAEATHKQVETRAAYAPEATEDRNGYGYQFWMCAGGGFRAAGLWGQICYVLPKEQLVVAASSSTNGSKSLLDPLYQVLWRTSSDKGASLADAGAYGFDALPVLEGSATAPHAERVLGRHACDENRFGFGSIDLRMVTSADGDRVLRLCLERVGKSHVLVAGHGWWAPTCAGERGMGELFPFATESAQIVERPDDIAHVTYGCYAWMSPSTLALRSVELDSTRRCNVVMRLDGNHVLCELSVTNMLCGTNPTTYYLSF